jgi:hypothetical protein
MPHPLVTVVASDVAFGAGGRTKPVHATESRVRGILPCPGPQRGGRADNRK